MGLFVLVALAYLEENVRGKLAWKKHSRLMKARGEPLDLKAFIPAAIPAEKNFASTPLLKPIYDFIRVTNSIQWQDTNALARLERTSSERKPIGFTNELLIGGIDRGTFADVVICGNFYRGNTNYPQGPITLSPGETILTALGKFDGEFKELRTANAARPLCRFPIEYEHEPSWEILLPHLAHIKKLTQLFQVHALAQLETSNAPEAFDDLTLGFRVADSIRDEPLLIDHLVRIAALQIALQTVREGLFRHSWTPEQLTQIQNHLESLNLLAEYKLAMRGERACSSGGLDYLRRNRKASATIFMDPNREETIALKLMPNGWFYQNMLGISEMHQKYLLPCVDENLHRIYPQIISNSVSAIRQMKPGPYNFYVMMIVPSLQGACQRTGRTQTYVDAAVVACALERFRLKKEALPQTLEEMTPEFIQHIPNDVIDGKPLRYLRKAGNAYLLYSIGWNGTDEGGTLGFRTDSRTPTLDLEAGDWVWQMKEK